MNTDTTTFAITNVDAGGSQGDIDSVGLLLPDNSGERAWIDLSSGDYFEASEVVDLGQLAGFLRWALNEMHAGKRIISVDANSKAQLVVLSEIDGGEPDDMDYDDAPRVDFRA